MTWNTFSSIKKYLDMSSPGQDLNHLTYPSWEWRSYAVPTTPQKLKRSINKIDIYSNRLPHKYEQYWTAWGYIMQSRTILVLRLMVHVLFHNSDFLFWFEKGNRKSLGDFQFSFSVWKWKSENRFNFLIFIYHLELKIRKLNLFSDFHFEKSKA